MSMNENTRSAAAWVDSPMLAAFNRVIVPVLLGLLVAYAQQISAQQTEQGKTLAMIQQQSSATNQRMDDSGARIVTIEANQAQNGRDISDLKAKVATLEDRVRSR